MCFSAGVSFGATAALAAIGVVSIAGARSRAHVGVAAMPLLFAMQQAIEGALWIHLRSTPWGQSFTPIATAFLFFAVFLWPVYVPFAFRAIETRRERRRAMLALGFVGIALGGYLFAVSAFRPSGACIAG